MVGRPADLPRPAIVRPCGHGALGGRGLLGGSSGQPRPGRGALRLSQSTPSCGTWARRKRGCASTCSGAARPRSWASPGHPGAAGPDRSRPAGPRRGEGARAGAHAAARLRHRRPAAARGRGGGLQQRAGRRARTSSPAASASFRPTCWPRRGLRRPRRRVRAAPARRPLPPDRQQVDERRQPRSAGDGRGRGRAAPLSRSRSRATCARALREMAKYLDPERTVVPGGARGARRRPRRGARGPRRGLARGRAGGSLLAGPAFRPRPSTGWPCASRRPPTRTPCASRLHVVDEALQRWRKRSRGGSRGASCRCRTPATPCAATPPRPAGPAPGCCARPRPSPRSRHGRGFRRRRLTPPALALTLSRRPAQRAMHYDRPRHPRGRGARGAHGGHAAQGLPRARRRAASS